MSAHGATPAEVLSAEQEINNKAYAAKARAQVVRIFGHCTKDQHVCLVMPSNEKFLVTVVEGGMSQQQKMQTAWQLAKAVQQMHDRHMLNLNIKPETVLLDDFDDVVLSGVGTLPQMPAGSQSLPSCHGTDNLRCEATQRNGACSQRSADVQSLACTILYMFTQTMPLEDMDLVQSGDALQAGQFPAIPESLPLDLQRMLRQCFTWPHTRSTAALMALKLQAMIEDTSVCQVGDKTSGMPFSAKTGAHQPKPARMTGGSAGRRVAAVATLVIQLQSNEPSSAIEAARRIQELAYDCQKDRIASIAAGAVPPLVAMLRSEQPALQEQAAKTLSSLAVGSQHNQTAIISAGAVPSVLTLLGSEKSAVPAAAAAMFWHLDTRKNGDAMVAAGALSPLIILLRSDQPALQFGGATALQYLARGSQHNHDAIIAAGMVPLLLTLVTSEQSCVQATATKVFWSLLPNQNGDAMVAAGVLPPLIALLRSDKMAMQRLAATALGVLAFGSQQARDDIFAAGAVPLLVALQRSDRPAVQEAAAVSLTRLAFDCQHKREAIIAAGGLPLLAALLRSEWRSAAQGRYHCSRHCAFAGCLAELRRANCARASMQRFGKLELVLAPQELQEGSSSNASVQLLDLAWEASSESHI